jgi:hypothetical protein
MPVFGSALQGEFVPLAPQATTLPNATYNTTNTSRTTATCVTALCCRENFASGTATNNRFGQHNPKHHQQKQNSCQLCVCVLLQSVVLQGEFVPLAPQLAALPNATYNTTTGSAGRFQNRRSTVGRYTYRASPSCVDKVTNAALLYDWEIVAPAYERLMITDAALLTLPASKSIEASNIGSAAAWEPIWNGIHQSFGVKPDELKVNFMRA